MEKTSLIQQWKDLSTGWKIANIITFWLWPWAIIPVVLGLWTLGPMIKRKTIPMPPLYDSKPCETKPYYRDTIESCKQNNYRL